MLKRYCNRIYQYFKTGILNLLYFTDREGRNQKIQHEFAIGTSGWSYKDWNGVFYPEKTPANRFLGEYSRRFNAVEIDSTFYAIPRIEDVRKWADAVPESFMFSPKFPRIITHEKRLSDCDEERTLFLRVIGELGEKLGPLLLQFDYTFQSDRMQSLDSFLAGIPRVFRIAVEIRHRSWYKTDFFNILRRHNAAIVLHDLYYMPKMTGITADFTYIRLLGNRKQIPDDFSHVRIKREKEFVWWAEKIREFMSREIDVFLFINNRYQGHAPASVRSFLDVLKD